MDVRADDNCRLWTAETGRGEPLIMCHGGPGLWDMSGSLAARLAERLTVIRWDQRGCGRSERRGPYSVVRSAADLGAVIGPRTRVALFGHSWGATLALRCALDHPDRVSALVYACGTGLGWAWCEPFGRASSARLAPHQEQLAELRAEGQDREVAVVQWSAEFGDGREREHAEEMATPWFGINQDCYTQIWAELQRTWHEDELIGQCRALEVPVLIIDGERDLRPRWAVDSLERTLPRVTRVILPDAGHIPLAGGAGGVHQAAARLPGAGNSSLGTPLPHGAHMWLTGHERERLLITLAADVAERRRGHGLKLNQRAR